MKKKPEIKKLKLNKKIISNLTNVEMNAVLGGNMAAATQSTDLVCTSNCTGGTSYWPYATDHQYDCLYVATTSNYC